MRLRLQTSRRTLLLLAGLIFVTGPLVAMRSPGGHTVARYRFDTVAAAELEARAEQLCSESRPGAKLPTRSFVTDGCSLFPDGEWAECCVEHDLPYWCGGSAEERAAADARLGECVAQHSPLLGALMPFGVRMGGHPWLPTSWRWGYGHEYPHGYIDSDAQ